MPVADAIAPPEPAPPAEAGLSYCAGVARRHDPDRFLCALFAPPARREGLFALYAFNHEVARTAEAVSQPMAGLIRLQWWRDAVDAALAGRPPPAHPVASALHAAIVAHRLPREPFAALIDAREFDLDPGPPADLAALEGYLEATSSGLVRLALRVLDADGAPAAVEAGRRVGLAWGLTGHLRALSYHAAGGRVFLPADRLRAHGVAAGSLGQGEGDEGLRRTVAELAVRAREHLAAARRLRPEVPRAALPALLPAALADRYLARLRRAGYAPRGADLARRPAWAPLALLLRHATGRF